MIKKDTPLKDVLGHGKICTQKCGHCCNYGTGCLVDDDIVYIAKFLNISEKELQEKYLEEVEKFNTKLLRPKIIKKNEAMPYGKCVFLKDDFGCSIHPVKPLQCQVGTCAEHGEDLSIWFSLNYFLNLNDPESIRQFASYLRAGGKTLENGKLHELVKDKELLAKILRYEDMVKKNE